jgi:hypothetical protein
MFLAQDATAQTAPCDRDGWEAVISGHAERYPLMTAEDMYKLIHQGVFGSEHAAPDATSARAWLEDELAVMGDGRGPDEVAVQRIAPGGAVVRVHLRPFLERGGDVDALLRAFLGTAGAVRGSVAEMRCAAAVVPEVDPARWPAAEWSAFVDELIAGGVPAVHHSGPFTAAYAPAYRVVAGPLVPGLGMGPR